MAPYIKKGDVVGRWTVLGDAPDRHYTRNVGRLKGTTIVARFLHVECACGHRREISLNCLAKSGTPYGSTQCITCSNIENGLKARQFDLKKRYGSWKVLFKFKIEKKKSLCLCECKCGYRAYRDIYLLKVGRTKGCQRCADLDVRAKISLETANKIKDLLKDGMRMCEISKLLGVKYHIVKSIKYKKAWK